MLRRIGVLGGDAATRASLDTLCGKNDCELLDLAGVDNIPLSPRRNKSARSSAIRRTASRQRVMGFLQRSRRRPEGLTASRDTLSIEGELSISAVPSRGAAPGFFRFDKLGSSAVFFVVIGGSAFDALFGWRRMPMV